MSVKATYENGVFKPIEPVELPEHTEVEVLLPSTAAINRQGRDAWEAAQGLIGLVKDAPKDMAEDHDFYLYGWDRSKP